MPDDDLTPLQELAAKTELERRQILRSHREVGFDEAERRAIDLRDKLDTQLGRIGHLELQAQTGQPKAREIEQLSDLQSLLNRSSAFAHYLDTYLYFNIRFAASRFPLDPPPPGENRDIVALPTPPPLTDPYNDVEGLLRLVDEAQSSSDIEDALDFLDGYTESRTTGDAKNAESDGGQPVEEHATPKPPLPVEQTESGEITQCEAGEADQFDLWLRGLADHRLDQPRFKTIARGIYHWAFERCNFYKSLERDAEQRKIINKFETDQLLHEGEWHAHNPLAARVGTNDLYWLSRILRADVDHRGVVTYRGCSWLRHMDSLPSRFPEFSSNEYKLIRILNMEQILRSVFDFACDLIQNAVEMAEYQTLRAAAPDAYPDRPQTTADWRAVYDREMVDIDRQRRLRLFQPQAIQATPVTVDKSLEGDAAKDKRSYPLSPAAGASDALAQQHNYWSQRVTTGDYAENLVGLSLSGGGIRSATFCLGVLQRLKEMDLLRRMDYLSTVSGGGYIGAWLLANVHRTSYWLTPGTNWHDSLEHLRRHSKYLAPESGILSADTWVIWGTWIRNAVLIQLTAVACLMTLFTAALCLSLTFDWLGRAPYSAFLLVPLLGLLVFSILKSLVQQRHGGKLQQRKSSTGKRSATGKKDKIVILAWLASFVSAAMLWNQAQGIFRNQDYSTIVMQGLRNWDPLVALVFFAAFLMLAVVSVCPAKWPQAATVSTWSKLLGKIASISLFGAVMSGATSYLCISAVVYIFGHMDTFHARDWYAYVFGPSLVMMAVTLSMVVFIGMIGRTSEDWRREWWTRFGSWLAIWGAGILAVGIAAIFAPAIVEYLSNLGHRYVKWTAVATWVASTVGGLIAGNSGRTKGETAGSNKTLEVIARLGAAVFIVGAVIGVSVLLRAVLVLLWSKTNSDDGWDQLQSLLSTNGYFCLTSAGAYCAPWPAVIALGVLTALSFIFCWRFNLNVFGLNQFYSNRLVRCYLGATRWMPGLRDPHPFIGFDGDDDLEISSLHTPAVDSSIEGPLPFRGPFPIINCSLNLGGSSDLAVQSRQSASFIVTPLYAGSDRAQVGYAPMLPFNGKTDRFRDNPTNNLQQKPDNGFGDGLTMGRAISISGAAASSNMGHNTSPLVAILLTMFNVRLAWWFPNPGRKKWMSDSPYFSLSYLLLEFLGLADEKSNYVNVSDGGHFENLGIYELVRRRAKVIIACDAECDPEMNFESLGNAIRLCKVDFDANIELDVSSIRKQSNGKSLAHCAVGRVTYNNGSVGYLIYFKASLTGNEETEIQQYQSAHQDFPHESTLNQFFTEDQFESYRRLGHHVAESALLSVGTTDNLVHMASRLWDTWAPSSVASGAFLAHTKTLDGIWERFRINDATLGRLFAELNANKPSVPSSSLSNEQLCACMELLQLMENVFVDLRLDDYWYHPDNRGWALLFTMWAKSPLFRDAWRRTRHTYGIRFEYFCGSRLGLEAGNPVARA